MIPGQKILLGFIVDSQGRSIWVDYSGAKPMLKFQQLAKPLRYMPEGWTDTKTKFSRNMKFMGLSRGYTEQYKFVNDGAFIIRSMAYGATYQGTETKIFFVVNRWNPDNGIHEFYSRAEIDLTEIEDDPYTGVTVNLIEGGVSKLLKAREAVTYEFPCNATNPDAKLITNDGVLLKATYNYSFPEALVGTFRAEGYVVLPLVFLNYEGNSVGIISGSPALEDYEGDLDSANYFFKTINATTVTIAGTASFKNLILDNIFIPGSIFVPGKMTIRLFFRVVHPDNSFTDTDIFNEADIDYDAERTVNINTVINLEESSKIYLIAFVVRQDSESFQGGIGLHETRFTLTFNSRNPVSTCWSVSAYDIWKQLCLKLTDGKYSGESPLLSGMQNIRLTCGDALRGRDTAVIKTSLNDFADKSFMKILNGAVGIEYKTNQIIFDKKDRFYDNRFELFSLGEVSDFEITFAQEFNWGSVKVGWQVKDTTDNLGKQEFNDTKNFTFPITRTSNVLDLVSFYRSDIFVIEQIRSDYFSKDQTATSKDNDVFIINTVPDGTNIVPLRESYASITGGDNPETWYNIEQLTPKRILKTNASYIGISLYALQNESIKFQSGTRNENLITTYPLPGGEVVVEKEDILVNDLAKADFFWSNPMPPFAWPFYFKFKTKVPVNFIPLLQAHNGYISFTINGIPLKGFPMDLAQQPVYDEPQEWKLLCSSLVDLNTLISLNDIYNIGGNGMISHKLPMKFVPLNAVYSEQFHFRHMDTDWHKNRISRYSQKKPFAQKMQTDDNTPLQFITNGTSMNNVVIINGRGIRKGTVVPTQVTHPAINLPWQLWVLIIDWSIFPPNDSYYAKISFGTGDDMKEFISEPVHLKTEWPETLNLIATNRTNKRDMIFTTTDPFQIKIRFEGMIQKFEPKSNVTSYEDEIMDVETLNGEPYRQWELQIGAGLGTPDWFIDKLNRILLLTDFTIDNYAYSIDKGAKLELKEIPGSPYAFYSIAIREKNNRPGIDIEESGLNRTDLDVQYDIETIGFSSDQNPNVNQQNNVIQITDIE